MKHLTSAFSGYNNWWRYLVLFLASFLGGQTIGGIPLLLVIVFKMAQSGGSIQPNPENMADLSVYGIDSNFGLFLMLLPFIVSFFILLVLYKPLHRRNYKIILTGSTSIRWSRFFMAAIIWASLSGIYLFTDYLRDPANYTFNFNPESFIVLLLVSIVLIPFQASFEEAMFRGYLAQGVGVLTKSRLLVILIPSLLFGLMHSFNPEVAEYGFWIVMPQYILFGLLFGIITVLDDGIELAMGAHSANNIFLSVFLTSKASSLQTQALLTQHKINAVADLISLSIISVLFIVILYFIYNWKFVILATKIENQVVESESTDPEKIYL